METKDIKIGAGLTMPLQSQGTGFRFESGTSTTTDTYIKVTPENGASVLVKPGQQFNIAHAVGNWTLAANDVTAAITGRVVIFNKGENFEDSNTSNTFKLDGTFTNSVNVNNDGAHPVPVTLGSGGPIDVQENLIAINGSYATVVGVVANTAVQILAPAANVNGVIIHAAEIQNSGVRRTSIMAKAAAPGSLTDSHVILSNCIDGVKTMPNKLKIPAGLGVWWMSDTQQNSWLSMAYTIL